MGSLLPIDEGEAAQIAVDMSGLAAPYDDLTGGTIEMSAERTTPSPVAVMAAVPGVLDAPGLDGKISGGVVLVPTSWTPGTYFCTITVDVPGAADHDRYWPQKQSLEVRVSRVAPTPTP